MDKFERLAQNAIESDPRIKVRSLFILTDCLRSDVRLVFTFQCPCGHEVTEGISWRKDLWKSRFDKITQMLRGHLYEHLQSDGLLG